MKILGLWDGHDAGAAIFVDGRLVAAANEERFTRRKLDVVFPSRSIDYCLSQGGIRAGDVDVVAACTSDIAKALGRMFPWTKESYYRVRRRLAPPGVGAGFTRRAKYRITEWRPTTLSRAANRWALQQQLNKHQLHQATLKLYDHHLAHAATAAYASGFEEAAIVTIDGVGDGCSASVWDFANQKLTLLARTPACHSPGLFFEHVTSLLNMRELEDEGKVMALADYASPVPDDRNPLLSILRADRLEFRTSAHAWPLNRALKRLLWFAPNEQFAFMAQRALEVACLTVVRNAVNAAGRSQLALAGGVASNVKINRSIRLLPEVEDVFVFPHMGDGGLACGAGMLACREFGGSLSIQLDDLGLGPEFDDAAIEQALRRAGLTWARPLDLPTEVADLIAADGVVLWFQGRMEFGPRALGHRSILARADRPSLRDRLNLVLKRRIWYQPFCPSVLESEARRAFADWKGRPNRHMTMTYLVRPDFQTALAGVLSVDGTCRPQILPDDSSLHLAAVLRALRRRTGFGAALNTSFNIHGQPVACSPEDAVRIWSESTADALAIGPFLVRQR